MWGMILSVFFNRSYLKRLGGNGDSVKKKAGQAGSGEKAKKKAGQAGSGEETKKKAGFGDSAMVAMFIGLVSAYLGSYIGGFISGNGLFSVSGDLTPILVVCVSALVMACFTYFAEKKHMVFLESFSIAGSMLIGMLAAVLFH